MSTTTINFTMKDLDGTVVPFKTFEISSGRLNTGAIPGTIPPNVFFTTNENGKATVAVTADGLNVVGVEVAFPTQNKGEQNKYFSALSFLISPEE